MRERKTWTTLEVKYIKENTKFNDKNQVTNIYKMAVELNRSEASVKKAIFKLRETGFFPKCAGNRRKNHNWTKDEVDFLVNNIEYDERNRMANTNLLSASLGIEKSVVQAQIRKLRRKGIIRSVDKNPRNERSCERYSDDEIKIVINCVKQRTPLVHVAEALRRSPSSVQHVAIRLREEGNLDCRMYDRYSEKEMNYLINNIQLDEHGYVCNYDELCKYLKRPYLSVCAKLKNMRKEGYIERTADRTTTSVRSKEAMDRFNDLRFAKYKCGKRKEYAKN